MTTDRGGPTSSASLGGDAAILRRIAERGERGEPVREELGDRRHVCAEAHAKAGYAAPEARRSSSKLQTSRVGSSRKDTDMPALLAGKGPVGPRPELAGAHRASRIAHALVPIGGLLFVACGTSPSGDTTRNAGCCGDAAISGDAATAGDAGLDAM